MDKAVTFASTRILIVDTIFNAEASVSAPTPFSWSLLRHFECPRCGWDQAYRSRRRGFLEKRILPAIMVQPVRCDRCYRRQYVLTTVSVLDRAPIFQAELEGNHPSAETHRRRAA